MPQHSAATNDVFAPAALEARVHVACCAGPRNPAVRVLIALARDDLNTCGGLVIHRSDGKILLVRREPNDTRPGEWEGPGGHIKADENAVEGAAREATEEVGPLPRDLQMVGHEHYPLDGGGSYTNVYVETSDGDWTPDLSKEHDDWNWFAMDELPAKTTKGIVTALGDSPWVEDPDREVKTEGDDSERLPLAAAEAPAPIPGTMRVVCAWCKREMGTKPASGEDGTTISHSMCEECAEQQLRELRVRGHRARDHLARVYHPDDPPPAPPAAAVARLLRMRARKAHAT